MLFEQQTQDAVQRAHREDVRDQLIHHGRRRFFDLVHQCLEVFAAEQVVSLTADHFAQVSDEDARRVHDRVAAEFGVLAVGFGDPGARADRRPGLWPPRPRASVGRRRG